MASRIGTKLLKRVHAPCTAKTHHRHLKTTTGIVGLDVQPEAKRILSTIYAKTLQQLEQFPKDSEYRRVVDDLTRERLAHVDGNDSAANIEAAIGAGQIEELIQQAEDELNLIPVLLEERVWETYQGSPIEEIYSDLKRRGIALQRHDIPMDPSVDYPTTEQVVLIAPAPPEDKGS